jgi:hypothetical protein
MATNGATWQITGVQLEAGSVATPFEQIDYGRELIMCQRYFELFGQAGAGRVTAATTCDMAFSFSVTKRATPTIAMVNTAMSQLAEATVALRRATGISVLYAGNSNGSLITLSVAGGGMTSPNMIFAYPQDVPNGFLSASAEL